jgi:hypothetical protein
MTRIPGWSEVGREWFAAFPQAREAAEHWRDEQQTQLGEYSLQFLDDDLPEVSAHVWVRLLLQEWPAASSVEHLRAVLRFVERASVQHGQDAKWLAHVVAEEVLESDAIEWTYREAESAIREALAWHANRLDERVAELSALQKRLARYRACASGRFELRDATSNGRNGHKPSNGSRMDPVPNPD